jgi:hypothetical protein
MGKETRKRRLEAARPTRGGSPPRAERSGTRPAAQSVRRQESTGKTRESGKSGGKRRLGLRGAAPWAARHAAKHAAEARARNAEPPRPGSARATLRTPSEAEQIKAQIGELHAALGKIRQLRKNLDRSFYELGDILRNIGERKLYEAKGYGSFEAFVEREIDLGKTTALNLARIPIVFREEAANAYGMDGLLRALGAIDEGTLTSTPRPLVATRPALPLKPPKGR